MKKSSLAVLLTAIFLSVAVWASDAEETIRSQLNKADARIPVQSIEPAVLEGFYQVTLESGEILYAESTGRYLLVGHLYEIDDTQGLVNLTEQAQNRLRLDALAEVPEADIITYPAEGDRKAHLWVFTDVDCPYCRRMHEEIPALNKMGVEVSYLAFPRGGPNTATYNTMVSIWCGKDAQERNQRMDRVKAGKTVAQETCENPVVGQLVMGQKIGVTGTPALVLEDGTLLPGYLPAERLAPMLGLN